MMLGPSAPAFEYPNLHSKPGTFRLINILSTTRSGILCLRRSLEIEIQESRVSDVGNYDTLSYVWGSGGFTREVIIKTPHGDRALRITRSLESALLSLAGTKAETDKALPIFVDQICINQGDETEKVQQVRLMGDIYTNCARVVVWLGDQTNESRSYFHYTRNLCADRGIMARVMGPNKGHFPQVFDAVMDASIEVTGAAQRQDRDDLLDLLARHSDYPVRGIVDVFSRPWFNRLWTIQEICLAPQVTFVCGEDVLATDDFRAGVLFYSIWNTYWVGHTHATVSKSEVRLRSGIFKLTQPFIRVFQERRAIHATGARRSLYELVLKYSVNDDAAKIGATKAEDRIYGLLGLAADDDVKEETLSAMEVDNARITYIRFTAATLKHSPDVLLFSQMPKNNPPKTEQPELPSWVPDWSAPQLRTPYCYTDLTTPVFTAGGGMENQNTSVDYTTGTLHIKGRLVDRVMRVGVQCIKPDTESSLANIEYISVQRLFEEIDEFAKIAATIDEKHAPDISTEDSRIDTMIRLSDGGLSTREFPARFEGSDTQAMLRRMHAQASKWGTRLIQTAEIKRHYSSIWRLFQGSGFRPWYWTPGSEVDVLRSCATEPVTAGRYWIEGFLWTIAHILEALFYFAKFHVLTQLSAFRRRWARVGFRDRGDRQATYDNVGLDPVLMNTREWENYSSNLLRNVGRKLFVTERGYVGLGPGDMKRGDALVVFFGGTTPHVLRECSRQVDTGSGSSADGLCDKEIRDLGWSYVGEAYCDGIMDGETVKDGDEGPSQSFYIH
ncbi:heterokaryon incompatibility protein-domain-containing protein [Xylariomycetidae sp. FL2044]|nr:heterokaryon incompatibility protein-domain-containing protein [Xylariomycetidae sp. FL2044]